MRIKLLFGDVLVFGRNGSFKNFIFISLFCLVSFGMFGQSLTITRNNFPSGTLIYGTDDLWTATTTDGEVISGYCDLATNTTFMQTRTATPIASFPYNVVLMPGPITKIILTGGDGSTRSWTPYLSTTALTKSNYSTDGISQASQNVSASNSTTWNVSSALNYKYFYLNLSGGATNLSSIVVEYQTTPTCASPTVALQSTSVNNITTTTANLLGTVTAFGGGTAITSRGFQYSISSTLATPTAVSESATTTGNYTLATGTLIPNTLYYYRAYAINNCATPQTGYSHTSGYPSFTSIHNAPNVGAGSAPASNSFTANWTAPSGGGTASFTYEIQVDDDSAFGSVDFTANSIAGTSTVAAV